MREQFGNVVYDTRLAHHLPEALEGPVAFGQEGYMGFLDVMFRFKRGLKPEIDYVSADRLLRYVAEREVESRQQRQLDEAAVFRIAGMALFEHLQLQSGGEYAGMQTKY